MKSMEKQVFEDFTPDRRLPAARLDNFRTDAGGSLIKRCGSTLMARLDTPIRGAKAVPSDGGDLLYLVAGDRLYQTCIGGDVTELGVLEGAVFADDDEPCELFLFGGELYILAGGEYFVLRDGVLGPVEGYAPCIIRNATPTLSSYTLFEPRNLLSDRVRIRCCPNSSTRTFKLWGKVKSIEKVIFPPKGEVTFTPTITDGEGSITLGFVPAALPDDGLEIHYTLAASDTRKRVTSNRHAAVYGGDTDSRVFLYGGSEKAAIFPSEPAGGDTMPSISAEYFPEGTPITVSDGNCSVTGAVRQFDRLAIFTESEAFYTYPRERDTETGLLNFTFPILPLNSDVGATLSGGARLVENEPFALNDSGLYRFKSTSVRDERLAVRVEAPDFVGLTSDFIAGCRLYSDKRQGELWCYRPDRDGIVIYDGRAERWYRFTGLSPSLVFAWDGIPAYTVGSSLYRFDAGRQDDDGKAYEAIWESGPLKLDDAFRKKTVYELGILLSPQTDSAIRLRMDADNGRSLEREIAGGINGDFPTAAVMRARLGRAHTVRLSLVSPDDGSAAGIHAIRLRYR